METQGNHANAGPESVSWLPHACKLLRMGSFETRWLSRTTAEILLVEALHGYVAMGTAGILCSWAQRGCSAERSADTYVVVGHCKGRLRLGIAGIPNGCALQRIGHCRDSAQCGWALQVYFAVEHCKDTWSLGTVALLCRLRVGARPPPHGSHEGPHSATSTPGGSTAGCQPGGHVGSGRAAGASQPVPAGPFGKRRRRAIESVSHQ